MKFEPYQWQFTTVAKTASVVGAIIGAAVSLSRMSRFQNIAVLVGEIAGAAIGLVLFALLAVGIRNFIAKRRVNHRLEEMPTYMSWSLREAFFAGTLASLLIYSGLGLIVSTLTPAPVALGQTALIVSGASLIMGVVMTILVLIRNLLGGIGGR